jgi:hypothetical protein
MKKVRLLVKGPEHQNVHSDYIIQQNIVLHQKIKSFNPGEKVLV